MDESEFSKLFGTPFKTFLTTISKFDDDVEEDIVTAFNELSRDLELADRYDLDVLECDELETKESWEKRTMKMPPFDWTKYDFNRSYEYLQTLGLRNCKPSLNSEWMKLLVNTQIYGGVGTIDDMLSYAGFNSERVIPSRKYRIVNFLQYYNLIEEVKRERKGGRIFEITKFAEDLIEWTAQH